MYMRVFVCARAACICVVCTYDSLLVPQICDKIIPNMPSRAKINYANMYHKPCNLTR